MRKPQFASKKSISATGWWKHARPFGKRMVNKSERSGAKRDLKHAKNSGLTLRIAQLYAICYAIHIWQKLLKPQFFL